MTIRKFAEWGRMISRPQVIESCDTDAKIGQTVARHILEQTTTPHIHATGGSLARSLGDPQALSDAEVREVNVDVMQVEYRTLNGQGHSVAANSILLRHRLWIGKIVAATNSGFLDTWEIATRAHPNDGRFDVVEVDSNMSIRDRLVTQRRLASGTLPSHPSITSYQCDSKEWTFDHPIRLYVDQNLVSKATFVRLKILPDAIRMVI